MSRYRVVLPFGVVFCLAGACGDSTDSGVTPTGGGGSAAAGGGGGGVTGGEGPGGTGGAGACSGNLADCDGECVDLQSDPNHCGDCNEACDPATESCSEGSCDCADPFIDCDGTCIDPQTDAQFCGATGDCQGPNVGAECDPQDGACVGGLCVCTPPSVECAGTCIDPQTDPLYCGATGDCQGPNAGEECDPQNGSCAGGLCVCQPPLVYCAGTCIDPLADQLYCGATGDCQGPNAGVECTPTAACTSGSCVDTCVNCGFELADFTGWTTQDLSMPFLPLSVDGGGTDAGFGFFVSAPSEGSWTALHGFDGDGPGTIELGQDITIAAVPAATLHFDYRAAWEMSPWGASIDRTFTVNIEPPGGGAPLSSQLILTAQAGTDDYDTGPISGQVDLSAYTGQQIRINFVWWVPEDATGPAFFQLDNIHVTNP